MVYLRLKTVGRRNWANVVGRCIKRRAASPDNFLLPLRALRPCQGPLTYLPHFPALFAVNDAANRVHRIAALVDGTTREGRELSSLTPRQYVILRLPLMDLTGSFLLICYPGRRNIASTSARQADITLTVDGKEVTVPQGTADGIQ